LAKSKREAAKDTRIYAEKERLAELFANLPVDRLKLADKLIDRAAFMLATLEEYESLVNRDGGIVEMRQGTYVIDREHPAAKAYNAMIKNYQLVIKQLVELLPDKEAAEITEELREFIDGAR